MVINYMFEKLQEHLGHDIECVMYGGQNISVECLDCSEVIYSVDKGDGYMYEVLKNHLGHDMECNIYDESSGLIDCLDCAEMVYIVDKYDI